MATYPSFGQLATTTDPYDDDIRVDRAVDGTAKARAFYSGRKHHFVVKHLLTSTDFATLLAFYDANRTIEVDFVWAQDGATYQCLFAGAPKTSFASGVYVDVEVTLVEI